MTETIAVIDAIAPATAERLRGLLPAGMRLIHGTSREAAHLHALVAEADYVISGQMPVDAALLEAASRAKLLHKWGVGVDNFDLDAARRLNIPVARTTGSNAVAVAEFTIGLMIASLRNLAFGHAALQLGQWKQGQPKPPMLLSGKTVGIIGFGAIGQNVARMLQAFRCDVLYTKTHRLAPDDEAAQNIRFASLPALLAQADVVSLHCPLTPATRGMIDRAALRSMKRSAVLINVARGGVVLEDDLVAALEASEIMGAGVDVYETEPVPAEHRLLHLPNVVVTPHIAAHAADSFEPTVRQMFGNILRVSRGEAVAEQDRVL
jgi:phosphoglycerate dehydrogenase-like enzyme